jgi:hypothetical protein
VFDENVFSNATKMVNPAAPGINPDTRNSTKTPNFLVSISETVSRFRRTFLAHFAKYFTRTWREGSDVDRRHCTPFQLL